MLKGGVSHTPLQPHFESHKRTLDSVTGNVWIHIQVRLVLSVAEFIDPDRGDEVNSGIGFVVPARQATWAGGPVRQPHAGPPSQGSMNSATAFRRA